MREQRRREQRKRPTAKSPRTPRIYCRSGVREQRRREQRKRPTAKPPRTPKTYCRSGVREQRRREQRKRPTAKSPRTPKTYCWSGVVAARGDSRHCGTVGGFTGRAEDRKGFSKRRHGRPVERFGSARWTETPSRSTAREPWSGLGPPDGPKRRHGRPWSGLGPPDGPKRRHGRPRANRGAVSVRQMDRNAVTVDRARTVERFGSARWTETPSRSTAREPWSGLGPPDGPKRRHGRPRANRGAVWVRREAAPHSTRSSSLRGRRLTSRMRLRTRTASGVTSTNSSLSSAASTRRLGYGAARELDGMAHHAMTTPSQPCALLLASLAPWRFIPIGMRRTRSGVVTVRVDIRHRGTLGTCRARRGGGPGSDHAGPTLCSPLGVLGALAVHSDRDAPRGVGRLGETAAIAARLRRAGLAWPRARRGGPGRDHAGPTLCSPLGVLGALAVHSDRDAPRDLRSGRGGWLT